MLQSTNTVAQTGPVELLEDIRKNKLMALQREHESDGSEGNCSATQGVAGSRCTFNTRLTVSNSTILRV